MTTAVADIGSSRLFGWLMPTHLADHEAARGSRLVLRVALLTLCVSLLMQAKYFSEHAHLIVLMTSLSIGLQVLGLVLHRATGSYKIGAHLLCLALWALFFGIALLSGGIDSPNLVSNVFIVVLAPMLLGRRHGLFWLACVSATYVGQFVMTSRGLVQQSLALADLPATRLSELIATSATAGLTAYFFAKGQERMRAEVANEKHMVDVANADLRVILDNSGQGFLSLDSQGRVTGERSAVIDSWLKGIRIGEPLWTRIRPIDVPVSSHFEMGWMQVEAQLLPLSVCLEQLPKRLLIGQTILSLEYRPVPAGGETFEKLVVIISDISAQVAREEAEVGQRDLLEAFQRILRDPTGFDLFLKSARRDVQCITSGDLVGSELLRCLHTLKGNSAVVGLSALGRACHELEDVLAREGALSRASLRTIEQEFSRVEGRLGSFVAASTSDIPLGIEEYEAFLGLVEAHKPYGEIARAARSWSQQRVGRHLSRLAEYAQKLAERLEKGQLQLQIEGGDLRMPDGFADFWKVAVHVVRNAIDHGIEMPNERALHGKGPGIIGVRATLLDGRSVVEISDDGRGIDWDRIRALSRARGIPALSEQDLLAALLSDGMSTSESISEISGRGVGMASVLKVCANLGVVIEVQSSRGSGTTFRFIFPEQPLRTSAGAHAA